MKQFSLLLLAMLTSGAALAHGHPAPVDDSMPDAQKIRFCERVRDHAVQALYNRDRGCTRPGCTRCANLTQAHHADPSWAHGGNNP